MTPNLGFSPNSVNAGERRLRSFLQLRVADRVYDSVTIERRVRKTLPRKRLTFAHLARSKTLESEEFGFGKKEL